MIVTHGSAPFALAPVAAAVVAAAPAPTVVVAVAAALTSVEAVEPEDQVDEAIALALKGISLTLSMDNPLGFSAMSPVSWESETQGEPP